MTCDAADVVVTVCQCIVAGGAICQIVVPHAAYFRTVKIPSKVALVSSMSSHILAISTHPLRCG